MGLETQYNRKTKQEEMFVEGEVKGIFFNELKNPKTYKGRTGNSWTPTHGLNIVVDDIRINLGLTDKDSVNVREGEGWHTLSRGDKITIDVEEQINGEYKNYTGRVGDIVLVEKAAQAPQQQSRSQGQSGGYKRDNSGMEAGHAINAAYCLLSYKPKDNEEVVEFAKKLHEITAELQAKYKAARPDMSEYDIGASCGHAVLNACRMLTKTKVDQVAEMAWELLNEVAAPVLSYVKKEEDKPEPDQEDFSQEEPEEDFDQSSDEDLEDDVPF